MAMAARGGKAGIDDEFNGRTAVRWNSDGGDSMVRYLSALRMLVPFSRTLRRCTFETMDAFDFLRRSRKSEKTGHGIYCDPPFPGAGRRYRHNAGQTDAEELTWHTRLRDELELFKCTRTVCRFYDHPMIRELYSVEKGWEYRAIEGRKQSNAAADELLLVRGVLENDLFTR